MIVQAAAVESAGLEPVAADATTGALAGRVVLVTGADGALGEVASRNCAAAGATVVLLGRRVPKLQRLHDVHTGVELAVMRNRLRNAEQRVDFRQQVRERSAAP